MFDFIWRALGYKLEKDIIRQWVMEKIDDEKKAYVITQIPPTFSRCVIKNKDYNKIHYKRKLRSYKEVVMNEPKKEVCL